MPSIERPIIQPMHQEHAVSDALLAYHPTVRPIDLSRTLNECLCVVETALSAGTNIENAHDTLDALAAMVRAEELTVTQWIYEPFLQRLTQLYADGCEQRVDTCMRTAAAYAGVIEAISHRQPAFDFTDAFGQLLELMTRLFSAQKHDWKLIYTYLRSIPDVVSAKQTLKRVCSADIREWFDAGVQNLFSLQGDLTAKIGEVAQHVEEIEDEIQAMERTLSEARHRMDPQGTGKVVALEGRFLQRKIAQLTVEKNALLEERKTREGTRALIESDIHEFEGFLREARRAYYLHIV